MLPVQILAALPLQTMDSVGSLAPRVVLSSYLKMLSKKLPGFLRRSSGDGADVQPADTIQVAQDRKDEEQTPAADFEKREELPTDNAQDGVKAIEAITISWSKNSLALVYVWCVASCTCPEIMAVY